MKLLIAPSDRVSVFPPCACSLASLVGLSLVAGAFALGTTIGFAQTGGQTQANSADAAPPAAADSPPNPEEIERAKELFRNSRNDPAARAKAAKVLYPLIQLDTTRAEVLRLLGGPDRNPKRDNHSSRFLNYVIGEGAWMEFEFDREQKRVVRKQETGLGIDPPRQPTPPIPENLKQYLADYAVDAEAESDRTTLRAGFIPYKPQIVWGEPLEVTMTVANVGDADFEFMFGGDYRGTGRNDRIKISITDAAGQELPDPHANAPDFGGISSFEIVTPNGLSFTRTLDLTKFRTIPGPGQYMVVCSFAFAEPYTEPKDSSKPVIKSAFPLTVLARTPERVSNILDELQAEVAATPDDRLPGAMAAIARFGQDDAVPRLNAYTKSGTAAQRVAAFAALPLVSGNAALDVALASAADPDPAIRIAAYTALGQLPQPRSVDALLEALTREQTPVKEAVLVALGTSKSERALTVLSRTLQDDAAELQSAAVSALVRFGGEDAVALLRQHVNSPNLPFRFQVVKALASELRSPLDSNWLVPILMCRCHNNREWLDSLNLIRVWDEQHAVSVLLSCVDFDVPWSHRNSWILRYVEPCKGAPQFDYIYDPNSQGTPEQHESNRQTLKRLREFAGPIPEPAVWPYPPIPPLETTPPIDFTVTLSTLKGEGETMATVTCGFFRETWNRNGGGFSVKPSDAFQPIYQMAKDVRAILASPETAPAWGLTEPQLQALRQLEIPPDYPVIEEGLTLLYIWWQESPEGPIRLQARNRLCDCVRAAVQQHHTAHVAFAAAADKIMAGARRPVAKPM